MKLSNDFYNRLNLNKNQREELQRVINTEKRFRTALKDSNVYPTVIDKIVDITPMDSITDVSDDLLTALIHQEFSGFIQGGI